MEAKSSYKPNIIAIVVLAVAAVLWFVGPFVMVSPLSGDASTTLDIITGDVPFIDDLVPFIDDLSETTPYWAAIASGAAIVLCLVCTFLKSGIMPRIFAVIGEGFMVLTFIDAMDIVDEFEGLISMGDMLGFGFWGVAVALLVVVIVGGRQKA